MTIGSDGKHSAYVNVISWAFIALSSVEKSLSDPLNILSSVLALQRQIDYFVEVTAFAKKIRLSAVSPGTQREKKRVVSFNSKV